MEFEVSYSLDNEQQFWDELDEILSTSCQSHELIDNALRSYLNLTTTYKGEYLQTEYDVARCSYKLLESKLFEAHKGYVRTQIIYGLLQEDLPDVLHLIAAFLLFDGKQNEKTFEIMNDEGAFPRILELITSMQEEDAALHRLLLQLLYEMSRIQRLKNQDLMLIEDDFIVHLLQIIEGLSDDVSDPYHYPVIRVLLVLNEQYMVAAHDPGPSPTRTAPLPNRVIKVLSQRGPSFRTFGENIILLLNRESETSLQLLILKLLYLLFTTRATYEYFYTNDLRVLVDVMVRNLLDLPLHHASAHALRHTYLRVLHPLLAHTQLAHPDNHYKRDEICKLLFAMSGAGGAGLAHFGAVDDTTKRLAARCAQVAWLAGPEEDGAAAPSGEAKGGLPVPALPGLGVNTKAGASSLSVMEMVTHKAKPGEQTPSRGRELEEARRKVHLGENPGAANEAGNGVARRKDGEIGVLTSPFEVEG